NIRRGMTIPSSASVWPRGRRRGVVDIIRFSIPSRGGRGERLVLHGRRGPQRDAAAVADEGPEQGREQLPLMRDGDLDDAVRAAHTPRSRWTVRDVMEVDLVVVADAESGRRCFHEPPHGI